MNLQINLRPDGKRLVFDRDKIPDEVEVLADDFICPPDAIEADGFTSAKAARAYIAKREGKPTVAWKRVHGSGYDGFEHRLYLDDKYAATIELVDTGGPWLYTLVDIIGSDELETLSDAKEAAEELAMQALAEDARSR